MITKAVSFFERAPLAKSVLTYNQKPIDITWILNNIIYSRIVYYRTINNSNNQ